MHTFKVVKEPFGWAVRVGEGMSTPFRSRELAVQEANCLCEALRRHGETAEVMVETSARAAASASGAGERLNAFWTRELTSRP